MNEEFWESIRAVFEDNDPFGMHESDLINHLKMIYPDEYEAIYCFVFDKVTGRRIEEFQLESLPELENSQALLGGNGGQNEQKWWGSDMWECAGFVVVGTRRAVMVDCSECYYTHFSQVQVVNYVFFGAAISGDPITPKPHADESIIIFNIFKQAFYLFPIQPSHWY